MVGLIQPLGGLIQPLDGLSQPLGGLSQPQGCLYSTGYRPLWGRCPAYFLTVIAMLIGRARVPLTISCLWATGLVII